MKSRKAPRTGGQFGGTGGLFRNLVSKSAPPMRARKRREENTLATPLRGTNPQSICLQSQQYIGFPALLRSPRHNLRHNLPQCVPRLIAPPHYMRALWLHVRPASPQVRSVCALPQPPRRSPSGEASARRVVLLPAGLRLSASHPPVLPKNRRNNKKRPHSVPPYSRPGSKRPYNRPSDAGDEVRDLVPVVEDDYTISYRQACHKMSHPDRP